MAWPVAIFFGNSVAVYLGVARLVERAVQLGRWLARLQHGARAYSQQQMLQRLLKILALEAHAYKRPGKAASIARHQQLAVGVVNFGK